jgi:hypothetical protein
VHATTTIAQERNVTHAEADKEHFDNKTIE